MKTVDSNFLAQQNKLTGSKAIKEVRVYKRYPWPITEITDTNNFKVRGRADAEFSQNDWIIVTTRKFSTKIRISGSPTYSSGETTIPATTHGLSTSQDVGGYIAKRYDVSRQVLRIGTISHGFEGQTLNEFRTGVATIEMNDRAYLTLYDEENASGVFYQKSWSKVISSVTPSSAFSTLGLTTSGLTTNALRGYIAQILSGAFEGASFPIITNGVNQVTVWGDLTGVLSGDEVLLAIENLFYSEVLMGFKNAL